ncbi:MAG: hypothetical protein LBK70_01875 [Clostridiales bacterium]|nr:hypothetical protein [Clostridiales bacterium]
MGLLTSLIKAKAIEKSSQNISDAIKSNNQVVVHNVPNVSSINIECSNCKASIEANDRFCRLWQIQYCILYPMLCQYIKLCQFLS